MSTFEPNYVIAAMQAMSKDGTSPKTASEFSKTWKDAVKKRVTGWLPKGSGGKETAIAQATFNAHCVQYVINLNKLTRVHGNAKKLDKTATMPDLKPAIPILGPRFLPATQMHLRYRNRSANVTPVIQYIKPLTIIHPAFFPELAICPTCQTDTNTSWEGWTTSGAREVQGVRENEMAIGVQLRCSGCEFCGTTTNHIFWEKRQHWEIPRGIPYFFRRCGIAHDLFDLITELRLKGTSAGLAENIKQLHLLEYQLRKKEYITYVTARVKAETGQATLVPLDLQLFSGPSDPEGYNDKPITHDMVTEVYEEFCRRTREMESTQYVRTLHGEALSIDASFKVLKRTTVVDGQGNRTSPMKGGLVHVINERGEIIAWRLCHTQAGAEYGELLKDLAARYTVLKVPLPISMTADNCCQARRQIIIAFPTIIVILDVYHFKRRYIVVILPSMKDYRPAISQDITNAILKTRAEHGRPAEYWDQDTQAKRLTAVFEKWDKAGAWSAAAMAVHETQLKHVDNGCLARVRQDIRSDGSRIESSHKGWNSLMRSHPCGLELWLALAHDHVLRRNLSIASMPKNLVDGSFVASLFGSHHIWLADYIADAWNTLCQLYQEYATNKKLKNIPKTSDLPRLLIVNTNERFGLVNSKHSETFGGLFELKKEEEDETALDTTGGYDDGDEDTDLEALADEMGIDKTLRQIPNAPRTITALSTNDLVPSAGTAVGSSTAVVVDLEPIKNEASSVKSERNISTVIDLTHTSHDDSANPPAGVTAKGKRKAIIIADDDAQPSAAPPKKVRLVVEGSSSTTELHTFFTQHMKPPSTAPKASTSLTTKPPKNVSTESSISAVAHTTAKQAARYSRVNELRKLLPLPELRFGRKLTRSEIFYLVGTDNDPRSFQITDGQEFFELMDLRAERGWATFKMTSHDWAVATRMLNERLDVKNFERGTRAAPKHPNALMTKLKWVEERILERIRTKNFTSTSGSTTFWTKHCFAVPLGIPMEKAQKDPKGRKPMQCSRCHCIMYPYATGNPGNHARGHCADGAPVFSTANGQKPHDPSPPWPLPQGIFTDGKFIHPIVLVEQLRNLYERIAVGSVEPSDLTLEEQALGLLICGRVVHHQDAVYFRLYQDLNIVDFDDVEFLIFKINGLDCLRLDCLVAPLEDGTKDEIVAAAAPAPVPEPVL